MLLAMKVGEQADALAKELYALCFAMGRPTTTDVLAVAAPTSKAEFRMRVMTGDEVKVSLLPTATAQEAIDGNRRAL